MTTDIVISLLSVAVLLPSVTGYLRGKEIDELKERIKKLEDRS
jgi:hypothetical protein